MGGTLKRDTYLNKVKRQAADDIDLQHLLRAEFYARERKRKLATKPQKPKATGKRRDL